MDLARSIPDILDIINREWAVVKKDDYIAGDHDFWIHFLFGLIFGAGFGAWIAWGLFDSWWAFIAMAAVIALAFAFCCGRWGDSAWKWIIEHLWWWFP
jgi:hypothetical protein